MPRDSTVIFLYSLICLIWGSTWLAIKIGLNGVPPFLGAGLRFLLASAVLFMILAARKTRIKLTRDDKISILSCGFLTFTGGYACVYRAEQLISSGLTAILFSTMPLMVALLSRFWTGSERLTWRKIFGIFVGIFGTVILFRPQGDISSTELAGMVWALCSSFSAAVSLVIVKKHSRHTDIYVLNALGMSIGAGMLLSLSLLTESYAQIIWSPANVLAIIYLALAGSITTFLTYYHLLKIMDATVLSLSTLIFPLVAVVLGKAFLGEQVPSAMALGMATVLSGVAIVILPARRVK